MERNNILVYDVNSLPRSEGIIWENLMTIYNEQGIVLYDSKKGEAPMIFSNNNELLVQDIRQISDLLKSDDEAAKIIANELTKHMINERK